MIYSIILAIVLLVPIMTSTGSGGINWSQVFSDWIRLIPFILIFTIHHFLLLPILLSGKNRVWYLSLTAIVIVVVAFLSPSLRFLNDWLLQVNPVLPDPMGPPEGPGLGRPEQMRPLNRPELLHGPIKPVTYYNFIVAVFLVGFDAALNIATKLLTQERRTQEVVKGQLQSELAFLRTQVSPHFFMNTLNNIHALIDENRDKAQEAVIRLSNLMRFLLYETNEGQVPLKKEIEFLQSYFELMRLRYDEKVRIGYQFPADDAGIRIHPLLSINIIENAFKHGISYQSDSFVEFNMELVKNSIEIRLVNSLHSNSNVEDTKASGLGLENLKRQLDMLYQQDYELLHEARGNTYFVFLKIPQAHD